MSYILTRSKEIFDLSKPELPINIEDIVHALSHTNRYCGHTEKPYSVAQHSFNVFMQLTEQSPEVQMEGLLHDASEAYLCDVPKPFKNLLGPRYKELEDRIMCEVAMTFGFGWPVDPWVKKADHAVLCAEMDWLFGQGTADKHLAPPEFEATILNEFWTPRIARDAMLSVYFALTN